MTEIIHLFVREEADGSVYTTSPQAPGLVYSEPNLKTLRRGIQDVLTFHFDRPGPFKVVEHHEYRYDVADRELVIRVAFDKHVVDRQAVQKRIRTAFAVPEQAEDLADIPTNKVGEIVYVCAIPTDTTGWLGDQLDPRSSDAFMVAASVSESLLFAVLMGKGEEYAWGELIEAERDMPLTEVMRKTAIVGPSQPKRSMIRVPA
jgi:hypothetical protein